MPKSWMHGDDERSEDREVGPADPVGEPSDEGGEGADGVRDDEQVEEVLERHVVVGQHQRRDGALHVVEVVEHDRGEHDDPQVPDPRQRVGIAVKLTLPQGVAQAVPGRDSNRLRRRRHVRPLSAASPHLLSGLLHRRAHGKCRFARLVRGGRDHCCVVIDVLLNFHRPQYSLIHNERANSSGRTCDGPELSSSVRALAVRSRRGPPGTLAAVEASRRDITDAGGVDEMVVAAGDTLTVDVRLADEA